jgi:hypothetical protein
MLHQYEERQELDTFVKVALECSLYIKPLDHFGIAPTV